MRIPVSVCRDEFVNHHFLSKSVCVLSSAQSIEFTVTKQAATRNRQNNQ